jgi:hypothetical protein
MRQTNLVWDGGYEFSVRSFPVELAGGMMARFWPNELSLNGRMKGMP